MPTLHDPATRESIKARLMNLRPDAQRQFGKMFPDQMLWHCAEAMSLALGKVPYGEMPNVPPLPAGLIRWLMLNGPWPKGKIETAPQLKPKTNYDFEAERKRVLALMDELASKPPSGEAVFHPILKRNTFEYQGKLHARHLTHHLAQFGA